MAKKASKKARKTAKVKKAAKAKKAARAKPRRGKAPAGPAKVASAFQIMIDKINETERLREKRGRDETD